MKLKEYQENRGDIGIFDRRNKVNNLTGKEWIFSTRSVITRPFQEVFDKTALAKIGYENPLPVLCWKECIRTFSKPREHITDPLCNYGATAMASFQANEDRTYRGFVFKELVFEGVQAHLEDLRKSDNVQLFESILSADSPPFSNFYTDLVITELIFDLRSGIPLLVQYQRWLSQLIDSFSHLIPKLTKNRYVLVSLENFRTESGHLSKYFSATYDVSKQLSRFGLKLKGELIWLNPHKKSQAFARDNDIPNLIRTTDWFTNVTNEKRILVFRFEGK